MLVSVAATAPGGPPIKRQSDEDIAEQNKLCEDIKQRSLREARQITAYADGSLVAANHDEALEDALIALQSICDELDAMGPLGVTAMTSLCNALLETDALKHLDALQKHEDKRIKERGTKLFQLVVRSPLPCPVLCWAPALPC